MTEDGVLTNKRGSGYEYINNELLGRFFKKQPGLRVAYIKTGATSQVWHKMDFGVMVTILYLFSNEEARRKYGKYYD